MSLCNHRWSLSFPSCMPLVAALALPQLSVACTASDSTRHDPDKTSESDDSEPSADETADDDSAAGTDDIASSGSTSSRSGTSSATTPSKTTPDAGTPSVVHLDGGTKPVATPEGGMTSAAEPDGPAGKPGATASANGSKPDDSKLPKVSGTCPNLSTGPFTVMGTSGTMWVGSKAGPLVFYWHGTASSAGEVDTGLPGATAEVMKNGGIVVSFEDTSGTGDDTGDGVWYTGDFLAADQILACGMQKGLVDTARIHSSGYSAGGLQTGAMVFARSNYLASAVVYSGGPALGGLIPGSTTFVDPSNVPATLGAHGAQGSDTLILDFSDGTKKLESAVVAGGGFAIDCDDGGSHLDFFTIRAGVGDQAWPFLKAHPYNSKPDPYAGGLPSGFPSYCTIVTK